ncbi:transmembrane protein [Planoprotostelium fungivorum]|uniref:Transmembrane protein n=1 Tax=Planoprotostelium fungivorum TaxID=1890364 RepID=A0A2P6N0S3_9EUKA|nr:transmembrane protein [Planoprotostelium fungivorum]PRP77518.1 transmembrane protein [Planoprotostelium fungivorum]
MLSRRKATQPEHNDAPDLVGMSDAALASKGEDGHREVHVQGGKYLKSIIYGGLDGIASTFVAGMDSIHNRVNTHIVAAVAGQSNISLSVALVMGLAKLFAGGFSMGVGDWLATDAELSLAKAERAREAWEFENYPEGEIEEMVDIYVKKGLSEPAARRIMVILSKYPQAFIDIMLAEEIGISTDIFQQKPYMHGLVNFGSFMGWGIIPLLVYIIFVAISKTHPVAQEIVFGVCAAVTAVTLFIMGVIKGRLTGTNVITSGIITLFFGALSAGIGYGVVIALYKITGLAID